MPTAWRCCTRAVWSPTVQPAEVLRAEILSEFYGVSVRVHYEDDGTAIVIPNRRAHA